MKQESVEQAHIEGSLSQWASSLATDMVEAGIVCVGCHFCLLTLGHKDRIHCKRKRVRRSVKAKKRCEYKSEMAND